ncbi:MAG TPA: cell wall-binding repeat-containing protein [Egibacteraceae bacterium]|nr:cell wall-binding repeat-containing protein [Egibacteraceae bacterium]
MTALLIALLSAGLFPGMSAADAAGAGTDLDRLAGRDRIETAVNISRGVFPDGASTAVLARADAYPDALAGGPLAAALEGPILLTARGGLSAQAAAELRRLAPTRVILLGGYSALAASMEEQVRAQGVAQVTRVAGADRYETAAGVARAVASRGTVSAVYLTEGAHPDPRRGWADAVSVSALASHKRQPILLVGQRLPEPTRLLLSELRPGKATVVGGEASVPADVLQAVASLGISVTRISGPDRYATSAAVADRALSEGMEPSRVWLATGRNYPDALTAGPAAARSGSLLLLVDGRSYDPTRNGLAWLSDKLLTVEQVRLVGGHAAITGDVQVQLAQKLRKGPKAPQPTPTTEPSPAPAPAPEPSPSPQPSPGLKVGPQTETCSGVRVAPGNDLHALLAGHPEGTTFCFQPGEYRLAAALRPKSGQRLIGSPGAVLNGSKLVTNVVRDGTRWVIPNQTQQLWAPGECHPDYPLCAPPDQVFIDSVSLRPVATLAALRPGTFFFDYGADKIFLADDPTIRQLEVSAGPSAAVAGHHRQQWPSPVSDYVEVANFIVEKFASPGQWGAIDSFHAAGWLVRNNEVRLNHAVGIRLGSDGRIASGVARGNHAHHNGQLGVGSGTSLGALIEGNLVEHNNTAGFHPGWEAGGIKVGATRNMTIRNNVVHNNFGAGIWSDVDNVNLLVEGNTVTDNPSAGIWHEISWDAVIRNNYVARNGGYHPWAYGAGIQVAISSNVEVYGNTVEDNFNDITVIQQNRGGLALGKWESRNVIVRDNTIKTKGGYTGAAQDVGDPNWYDTHNIRFQGNHYIIGTNPKPFHWKDARRTPAEWRAFGNDSLGVFQ